MAAIKRTLFPPTLNIVSLPTCSADGKLVRNSAKFEKSLCFARLYQRAKAEARSVRLAERAKNYQIARVVEAIKSGESPTYTIAPVIPEVICLAMNIYYEARSDPVEGRLAVAWVTVNRARVARTSICYEVFKPWQFSW